MRTSSLQAERRAKIVSSNIQLPRVRHSADTNLKFKYAIFPTSPYVCTGVCKGTCFQVSYYFPQCNLRWSFVIYLWIITFNIQVKINNTLIRNIWSFRAISFSSFMEIYPLLISAILNLFLFLTDILSFCPVSDVSPSVFSSCPCHIVMFWIIPLGACAHITCSSSANHIVTTIFPVCITCNISSLTLRVLHRRCFAAVSANSNIFCNDQLIVNCHYLVCLHFHFADKTSKWQWLVWHYFYFM